jgi:hypothetical protein
VTRVQEDEPMEVAAVYAMKFILIEKQTISLNNIENLIVTMLMAMSGGLTKRRNLVPFVCKPVTKNYVKIHHNINHYIIIQNNSLDYYFSTNE